MGARTNGPAPAPRRRLRAEEARERILQVAERKIAEVGPEGLRLAEVAAELGISHPAILHHFGRREDLVGAVAERISERFQARLLQALDAHPKQRDSILEMIGEFFGSEGTARLLAWLVLSKRSPKAKSHEQPAGHPLQCLIDRVHTQRTEAHPERAIEAADTEFRSLLIAYALLGEALFGELIRPAAGVDNGPSAGRDFRQRLAALLSDDP